MSKEALKRVIIPMDCLRFFEIPATFKELKPSDHDRIFDLSSPKLLSLLLAEKYNVRVVATDIWKEEIAAWGKIRQGINNRKINKNLSLKVVDGRKLKYRSNYFDKIYSISVIEHIEGDGDTKSIRELARVLKPGGTLVVTVPLGEKYSERWVNRDVYSMKYDGKAMLDYRRYDFATLKRRIINPSGLFLEKKIIVKERYPIIDKWYKSFFPVSALFGLTFPILAKITLKAEREKGEVSCILLVLKKLKSNREKSK